MCVCEREYVCGCIFFFFFSFCLLFHCAALFVGGLEVGTERTEQTPNTFALTRKKGQGELGETNGVK